MQGSQQAGQYILDGASVLPMGGFSGAVPFPTVNRLRALVSSGQLRFVILGGGPGGNSAVADWVTANCTATAVSGTTVYDCRAGG